MPTNLVLPRCLSAPPVFKSIPKLVPIPSDQWPLGLGAVRPIRLRTNGHVDRVRLVRLRRAFSVRADMRHPGVHASLWVPSDPRDREVVGQVGAGRPGGTGRLGRGHRLACWRSAGTGNLGSAGARSVGGATSECLG